MKIQNLKEKIDGAISLVDIGDVSFAILTKEWENIKEKLIKGEEFAFNSISNKLIKVKNKTDGKLQIIDTFTGSISNIEL